MVIRNRKPSARRGFTLIELLVVIGLIAFMATLALAIAPGFSDSQKAAYAASKLQGWLAIAKQRAYRDKIISGVRLQDPTNSGMVSTLSYIVQPDDFTGGQLSWTKGTNQAFLTPDPGVSVAGNDFLAIFSPPDPQAHKIASVTAGSPATLNLVSTINIDPPLTGSTNLYKIVRQPRQLTGEPDLVMVPDMVIGLTYTDGSGNTVPLSQPAQPVDVLFQPTGEVLIGDQAGGYITRGKVILWVYDISQTSPYAGEPTLITVFCRTGAVAAFPVNTNPAVGDYYQFTKEGRYSGL